VGLATVPLNAISDINVWLGRSNWPDPPFSGQMDDFRIYDGVLSDAAIAASFAAGPDATLGGRPRLRIAASSNAIELTWPSDANGYALEAASTLAPGAIWSPVTDPPVFQYDKLSVTLPTTNFSRFFRLKK
jgi:hypothetical protein